MENYERNVNTLAHYFLDFTSGLHSNISSIKSNPRFLINIFWPAYSVGNAEFFKAKFYKLSRFLCVNLSIFCSNQPHSTGVQCTFQILYQYYKVIPYPNRHISSI